MRVRVRQRETERDRERQRETETETCVLEGKSSKLWKIKISEGGGELRREGKGTLLFLPLNCPPLGPRYRSVDLKYSPCR